MTQRTCEKVYPPDLPYDYSGMSLDKALILIEGAREKASLMGCAMTLTVCDASGNTVAIQKMDDAPLLSLEIAGNKARTAVFGKIPTYMWGGTFRGAEPEVPPLFFHSNWITFMGGFPVVVGNKIIGGLGSSGATWEDGVIARSGLLALGADVTAAEQCLEIYGVPREKW
jgi:uncharacterized protein GlcG (DUF336 family)